MNHWTTPVKQRSLNVNGELLRFYRQQRGWTQQQAATRAGYSLRLIKKAESGGSLHPDTIEILAKTYSSDDTVIYPEDLICSPSALVQRLLGSYVTDGRQMVDRIQDILSEQIRFHYAGDPTQIPFAGQHIGHDGVDRFWEMFFAIWTPTYNGTFAPKLIASGTEIVTFGEDECIVPEVKTPVKTFICQRFKIKQGQIHSLDVMVDTQAIAEYLKATRPTKEL